jgi:hypothetical protein
MMLTLADAREIGSADKKHDRFFDSWRMPNTGVARAMVHEVIADVQSYEQTHLPRQRRRKTTVQNTFEATLGAILCDLAHAALSNDERDHVVPRSKRVLDAKDRYRSPAVGGTLPAVLDLLERAGWLHQKMGELRAFGRNKRTVIKPSARLVERIEAHGLTLSDISRSNSEEVLILKTIKENYWHKGDYAQYEDTDETRRLRGQVRTINNWIAEANIEFHDPALGRKHPIDSSDVTLRRYFSRSSFQSGGRLFGGFWQGLSEKERLDGILINGEEVAECDYGQIAARILYGLAGVRVPEGDLYAIPGLMTAEGNPYRAGIKLLFNSLTFMEGDPSRKPKKSRDKLPPGMRIEEIVELIRQAHSAIACYFGTPTGHYVQFRESEVMLSVLLRLREDNIIGLPIHDALVVPISATGRTIKTMRSIFEEMVGLEITISCDTRAECTDKYDALYPELISDTQAYVSTT